MMVHRTCDHLIDDLAAASTTEEEAVISSSQTLMEEEGEEPSTRLLPQVCPIPQRLAIGRDVGGAPVTQELVEVRESDDNVISLTDWISLRLRCDWNGSFNWTVCVACTKPPH